MVSILFTHYNRPEELKKCLEGFRKLDVSNLIYIVTDDGSELEYREQLLGLKVDKLIVSETNKGLTSNINRGLKECTTEYVLYCQEDFIPKMQLGERLPEIIQVLNTGAADMVRLKANYSFPKLIDLTENIKLIPKFSWQNFYYNAFQYSDNPFITTRRFFEKFGYYLENTSGPYGENEYAIRIMKSKAKIAIVREHLFSDNKNAPSVIDSKKTNKGSRTLKKIGIHKFLRAVRLHLEYLFYNPKNRGLLTIKNQRGK